MTNKNIKDDLIYNEELAVKVIKMYLDNNPLNKVCKELGLGYGTGFDILEYHKIPKRESNDLTKTKMKDERFFEKIDTEEKAYFLGWLYSDGNVCKKMKTISIDLHGKDMEILEKLNDLIYFERKCYKYREKAKLLLCRKIMCEDFLNKGCMPAKTYILKFPTIDQVPENLLPHFIRGLWDGDGTWFFSN